MEFDLSGPLRAEEREDGWYVVGQNLLIPVANLEQAKTEIAKHSKK